MIDSIRVCPARPVSELPTDFKLPAKAHRDDAAYDLAAYPSAADVTKYGCGLLKELLATDCFTLDKKSVILNGSPLSADFSLDQLLELEGIVLFSPYLLYQLQSIFNFEIASRYYNCVIIGTGIKVEIDYYSLKKNSLPAGLILPRSGLACKYQLGVANSPGLIDPGYRGEIKVALENRGAYTHIITPGARIAQLLIIECVDKPLHLVPSLSDTTRSSNGFGSTGV
jgi:deoxyuridine 5'-triphosphate nucleotidohydrolase